MDEGETAGEAVSGAKADEVERETNASRLGSTNVGLWEKNVHAARIHRRRVHLEARLEMGEGYRKRHHHCFAAATSVGRVQDDAARVDDDRTNVVEFWFNGERRRRNARDDCGPRLAVARGDVRREFGALVACVSRVQERRWVLERSKKHRRLVSALAVEQFRMRVDYFSKHLGISRYGFINHFHRDGNCDSFRRMESVEIHRRKEGG